MTKKWKPIEIANALKGLCGVTEREEKYCDANAETKFPAGVAIAIAKNRRALEHEFNVLAELEKKNKSVASRKGEKLEKLPEQIELMRSEIEVEISVVPLSELEKGKGLTSEDFYDLFFMTDNSKEGKTC